MTLKQLITSAVLTATTALSGCGAGTVQSNSALKPYNVSILSNKENTQNVYLQRPVDQKNRGVDGFCYEIEGMYFDKSQSVGSPNRFGMIFVNTMHYDAVTGEYNGFRTKLHCERKYARQCQDYINIWLAPLSKLSGDELKDATSLLEQAVAQNNK